jgi:regulator of ribosome biosynthesis
MTRWEKFAKEKGIVKRKRDRQELDETTGDYKPRFGRGKAARIDEDWVIEAKGNEG